MKFFAVAVISLWSALSFAQDTRNEFFYQAKKGERFIQANYTYDSFSLDVTDEIAGQGEVDGTDNVLQGTFEYGLTEIFSVYGNIGYGSGEVDTVYPGLDEDITKSEGINPINVGAKGTFDVGTGKVFARANLNLGILGKEDCDNFGDDCNRTDGSNKLSLRLGYLMSYDSGFSGLALDLGLLSTDGEDTDGFDYNYKNGYGITAFYEHILNQIILGGSLNYRSGNLSTTDMANTFYIESFDFQILALNIYTRVPLIEGYDLLANVNYNLSAETDAAGFDDGTGLAVGLGLRVAL